VDMGFAQDLAESSTVIVRWASGSVPVSHRPMGVRLDLRDVSNDGHYPERTATVTSYSLLEPTPEMRRQGILGIGCKSELRCEHGRIGGTRYPGIDGFLHSYPDTSARVSLVPLSKEEWRRATGLCDEYESDKEKTVTERAGDGVGATEGHRETVGRKVSDTAGYDAAAESLERIFESRDERTAEFDSFEVISSEWNEACRKMTGRR